MTNSHPVIQALTILTESGMQAALDRAKTKAQAADIPPRVFIEASLAFIVTEIYIAVIKEDLETKVGLAADLDDLFREVLARTILSSVEMKNAS